MAAAGARKTRARRNRSSTAQIKYTRLNTFLKYAVERHWLEENPVQAGGISDEMAAPAPAFGVIADRCFTRDSAS